MENVKKKKKKKFADLSFFLIIKDVCMVFPILGKNLWDIIEELDYQPFPLEVVKHITKQLLIGLEFAHSNNIIHTDIKPENVTVEEPSYLINKKIKAHLEKLNQLNKENKKLKREELIEFIDQIAFSEEKDSESEKNESKGESDGEEMKITETESKGKLEGTESKRSEGKRSEGKRSEGKFFLFFHKN